MKKREIRIEVGRIGLRLIIPYLIISFLTLMLIGGLIYYSYEVQTASIQKIQEEISLGASSEIDYYVESIIKELNLASKNIFCIECENEVNIKILKNLMSEDPSIYAVSIINKEGKEIDKIIRYEPKKSSLLKDVSTEDEFKKAIEGSYYVGHTYISKYEIPFIPISLPIEDENKTKIGVLATEIDLSPMWETVSKIKVKETGYVYVVDQDGYLIAYKDVKLIKENLNLKYILGVENFLNNIGKSATYVSFNNEMVTGMWKPIEITGWGLITELPTKEIFQELSVLFFIGGISVVIFISFIIIILMIIFKRLLTPISYLQKGVTEIKSGNLDYNIEVVSKDEIGQLASAFNQMVKDLKKSRTEIEKYSKNLEKQVSKRTEDLNEKVKELTDAKNAMLNMTEDLDETNRKLMETQNQLKKSFKELKELDVDKDRFISIAAHELKTPMTAVHGFAQLLEKENIIENEEIRTKYLKIIETEIERLGELVTDVLDLSRIDLGTMKFNIEDADIVKIMEDVKDEMTQKVKEKGLTLDFNIDHDLPIIKTDKEKLREVLINLIDNSVKYTSRGGIKIDTHKEGNYIKFSVTDTGIGIPKKYFNKLFTRFYQVESPLTRKVGGSGLGLSICKEYIEKLGGRIWLKSKIGKGTTFYFTLPIKKINMKH